MVIAITRSGYIKRLPVTAYREQRRGGVGVMGMELKEDDYIEHLFVASTHDYILFFTNVGKVYRLKVHELPLGSRQSKGRAIVNLLPFRQDEQVRAVIQTREFKEAEYLVFATRNGLAKKDALHRLQHAAQSRRDHRHQSARGRRAGRRSPLHRSRRHSARLAQRAGDPLPRDERTLDGAARLGRAGHAPARGRRGDRDRDRPRRHGVCWSSPRTATASERVSPTTRPRVAAASACKTIQLTEARGRLIGRQGRSRRLPGDADLDHRHDDQDPGRGRAAHGSLDSGRDRDAAARR